jgi:hypothetical protein
MAAAAVAPPRLRWPAPLTAALIVLFPEAFPMYLMRRFGAGRAVSLRMLGMGEAVVFSDPAAIKEVFAADRDALRAGEAAEIVIGPVAGDGSLLRPRRRRASAGPAAAEPGRSTARRCTATARSSRRSPRRRSRGSRPGARSRCSRICMRSRSR